MSDLEIDLRCRCRGASHLLTRADPLLSELTKKFYEMRGLMGDQCDDDATEEDGLCDRCRCPHGACEEHKDYDEFTACADTRISRGEVEA